MGSVTVVITVLMLLLGFFDNPHGEGLGRLKPTAMERSLRIIDAQLDALGLTDTPRATSRATPPADRHWPTPPGGQPGSASRAGGRVTRMTTLTSSTQAGKSSCTHFCASAATSSRSATSVAEQRRPPRQRGGPQPHGAHRDHEHGRHPHRVDRHERVRRARAVAPDHDVGVHVRSRSRTRLVVVAAAPKNIARKSSPLPRNTVENRRSSTSPSWSRTTPTNHRNAMPANGTRFRLHRTSRSRPRVGAQLGAGRPRRARCAASPSPSASARRRRSRRRRPTGGCASGARSGGGAGRWSRDQHRGSPTPCRGPGRWVSRSAR